MRLLNYSRWLAVGILVATLALPALWLALDRSIVVEVDGNSMAPTYLIGDVILVQDPPTAGQFAVGDVVTVEAESGSLYTHRIIEIDEADMLQLQGDANATADPGVVPPSSVRGVVSGHVGQPLAGVLIELQGPALRVCLLAVIIGLSLLPIGRVVTRPDAAGIRRPDDTAAAPRVHGRRAADTEPDAPSRAIRPAAPVYS